MKTAANRLQRQHKMQSITNKTYPAYTIQDITVIILAGGQGKRLGNQNKGLLTIDGETFISRLLRVLEPQSAFQIISANNDIDQYMHYKKKVIQDKESNYQGPLSGIISCKDFITTPLVLTVPCDSPLIPDNLSEKLLATFNQHESTRLCVVHDGTMLQNLFMLFNVRLLDDMEAYFNRNQRKVRTWINSHQFQSVDFSEQASKFTNINDAQGLHSLLEQPNQERVESSKNKSNENKSQ